MYGLPTLPKEAQVGKNKAMHPDSCLHCCGSGLCFCPPKMAHKLYGFQCCTPAGVYCVSIPERNESSQASNHVKVGGKNTYSNSSINIPIATQDLEVFSAAHRQGCRVIQPGNHFHPFPLSKLDKPLNLSTARSSGKRSLHRYVTWDHEEGVSWRMGPHLVSG